MTGSWATVRSCGRAASSSGNPLVQALMGTYFWGLIRLYVLSVIHSLSFLAIGRSRPQACSTPSLCRCNLVHKPDHTITQWQVSSAIISAVQHIQLHRTHCTAIGAGDRTSCIRRVLHVREEAIRAQRGRLRLTCFCDARSDCLESNLQ